MDSRASLAKAFKYRFASSYLKFPSESIKNTFQAHPLIDDTETT